MTAAMKPGSGRVSAVIVRRIKKDISEGKLVAGARLPAERELARRFKTSRVSVREAYRSLEEVGLLSIRRGAEGGAFIADIGHEPVTRSLALMLHLGKTTHQELTEARLLLEPPVARLAARRASSEDIDQLADLLRKQESALKGEEDPRQYDLQFHRLIAECAKNLPIKIVMNSLADLTLEAIAEIGVSPDVRRHVVLFHRRIFRAIRRRDEDAAYQLMIQHIGGVQSRLGKTLARQLGGRDGHGALAKPRAQSRKPRRPGRRSMPT